MIPETWESDASRARKAMLAAKHCWSTLCRDALEFASYAFRHARFATALSFFALLVGQALMPNGDVSTKLRADDIPWADIETALIVGFLWAQLAVMWRIATD
jgi:hypothetical protein